MKSFRQLIVENEKEYLYWIKSTEDIHLPERLNLIRLAAMPHQCFKVEPDFKTPAQRNNDEFPEYPNSPCYAVKVYLGIPCTARTLELEIKSRLNFRKGCVKVENDAKEEPFELIVGNEPYQSQDGKGFTQTVDDNADKAAGPGRFGEFMKELEADRKARAKQTTVVLTYESFIVPPEAVANVLNEDVRRGFYFVESRKDGLTIDGPFSECPPGMVFKNNIFETDVSLTINKKSKIDGHDRYELSVSEV